MLDFMFALELDPENWAEAALRSNVVMWRVKCCAFALLLSVM